MCTRSAELERIDSRTRMADTAAVACTAGAGIGVVAVPAFVVQSMLVDHPGCDRIIRLLGIAYPASRLAFLLISTDMLKQRRGLTLLGMLLLCIPLQLPTHSVRLFV